MGSYVSTVKQYLTCDLYTGNGMSSCPSWLAVAVASAHSYKWANWVTRVIFACLMAVGFSFIIYLGPLALVLLILLVQVTCFSEVTRIAHRHYDINTNINTNHKINVKLCETISKGLLGIHSWTWYLLVTANYFFFTEFLSSYFNTAFLVNHSQSNGNASSTDNNLDTYLPKRILGTAFEYHRIISFTLYLIAILWFVILDNKLIAEGDRIDNSKIDCNRNRSRSRQGGKVGLAGNNSNISTNANGTQQLFSLFAFTHVVILVLVAPSYLIIQNLNHGLIWFIVPVSMVNWNDAMAYLCGSFWGRRPLIQLSPKKTWEGFVGGGIATILFGAFLSYLLCQYQYLVCPLPLYEITPSVNCTVSPLFIAQDYKFQLPTSIPWVKSESNDDSNLYLKVELIPFVLHSFSLSVFTSVIGPFGGFFASGFKRAFHIKDFGHVIPGHGGVLDRFDCQFLLAAFVNVYITTFILHSEPGGQTHGYAPETRFVQFTSATEEILHKTLSLESPEQIKFIKSLQDHLTQRGILQGQGT